jgi:hypothetical protein
VVLLLLATDALARRAAARERGLETRTPPGLDRPKGVRSPPRRPPRTARGTG